MLTGDQFPQGIQVDLKIAYTEGRQSATDPAFRRLTEIVPTNSTAKTEVFYGDKGRLRRFRAERQPQQFNEYKQVITLDDWEYTTTVKKHVLDDDQSGGVLRNKVVNFGNVVESSLQIEFWEFLHNGTSTTGFDGQNLFDFFHTYTDSKNVTHGAQGAQDAFTGATQDNMHLGGSQVASSTVQLLGEHFSSLLSDTGKVLGMRLTDIAVKRGSLNHKAARELSNSQFTVDTGLQTFTENVFRGAFGIIEFDYGAGSTEWYGFDLSDASMKPVKVLSHNKNGFDSFEFTSLLQDSETGFWRNEFAFGVMGRFDYNPGDWRTCFLHGSSTYTFTPSDSESQRVLQPNA